MDTLTGLRHDMTPRLMTDFDMINTKQQYYAKKCCIYATTL